MDGALDRLAPECPGARDRSPKAAQDLLVEQRRQRTHGALVDDEANRVRPDIDDAERFQIHSGVPCYDRFQKFAHEARSHAQTGRLKRGGKCSFKASPRPDKLGLVMKYLWALNGSSPGAS